MIRYGFIGTGSMGSMLVRKFTGNRLIVPADIAASSKTGISARALADRTGITAEPSNTAVAAGAGVLFICVKPAIVRSVLEEIRPVLGKAILIVSIAGGVTLADLKEWAGPDHRYVRVIPSVAAEQESEISLVTWGRGIMPEDKALILSLFNAIGIAVETDEGNFDLYADLTSCAPAFIAVMMREFAKSSVRTGAIEPVLAEYLVRKTLAGTTRILDDDGTGFDTVIARVATRGGSPRRVLKSLKPGSPQYLTRCSVQQRRSAGLLRNSWPVSGEGRPRSCCENKQTGSGRCRYFWGSEKFSNGGFWESERFRKGLSYSGTGRPVPAPCYIVSS